MEIIKSSFIAFFATLFCIWLLRPLACRIGFVDRPGGRKWHENEVPLIGGVAMFFGFCFSLLTLHVSLEVYRGLLAGSGLLMLIGVVDDFNGLSAKARLLGQLLAALLLAAWGHQLVLHLGNIFFLGGVNLGIWAFPVTVLAVMGYINAMNMMDGQDGLAGSVALGQVLLLLFLSVYLHRYTDVYLLIVTAILLLVFLAFNMRILGRKKASIFMGDSGSTFIAFLIAWFAVNVSQADMQVIKPITVLWVLAFPLFDLISVSLHRIWQGKSPFTAGRDHFHHVLHANQVDTTLSTWLLCLLSLGFGVIGITINFLKVADGWQFAGLLAALACYLFFVRVVRNK